MWIYFFLALVGCLFLLKRYRGSLKVDNLRGRHVLITGCDHGFGRMLAEKLDKQGVQVFATCLHRSSVRDLEEKCSSNLKALVMDVTDEAQIKEAVAFTEDQLKGKALWCLVNNAGYLSPPVVFEMATKEDFREVMNVNLFGMVDVTRAFLPLLRRGDQGRIVNVSSMNGRMAVEASPYSCSKFGVESFSDGLSYSLSPFNITVHTIEPGYFRTDMNNPEWGARGIWKRWEILDDNIKAVYGRKFMEEYCQFVVDSVKNFASDDLQSVVRAMNHAVVGKHPKNRYVVGWDAMFLFRPVSMLPVPWAMLIMRLLGVSKAKPLTAKR